MTRDMHEIQRAWYGDLRADKLPFLTWDDKIFVGGTWTKVSPERALEIRLAKQALASSEASKR